MALQNEAVKVTEADKSKRSEIIGLIAKGVHAGGVGMVDAVEREIEEALARHRLASSPPASEDVAGLEEREACAFADCPPGLFKFAGMLCFKSEYSSKLGQQDAYCVDSGEYFWGGTSDLAERRALIVTPLAALAQHHSPSETEGR